MCLLATGASSGAGLSAAKVFGARQFVGGIINDFVRAQRWRGVGAQAVNLPRKNHDDEEQKRFQQKRSQQTPVGQNAEWSFAGQAWA